MDYWHDEKLEEMVETYRKNRDPAPLTRLINLDYKAMQAPAIGRLFLDIINGRLPPLEHRPDSTSEIRERAIELVFFYLGSNVKKTKAFSAAGIILGKSGDTIKGYMNDWLKSNLIWGFDDVITESEFWAAPEKYIGQRSEFIDGRVMVDDSIAELVKPETWSIEQYRQMLLTWYEKNQPIEFDDPWISAEKVGLLNIELRHLKDD